MCVDGKESRLEGDGWKRAMRMRKEGWKGRLVSGVDISSVDRGREFLRPWMEGEGQGKFEIW